MKSAACLTPIPAFDDNYIWLVRHGPDCAQDAAVVVDPGASAPVLAELAREKLTLRAILLTHHHRDHVGGVAALVAATGATVYGPARECLPSGDARLDVQLDVRLAEGDRVQLDGLVDLTVLDVPGHTAGHIAYHGTAAGNPVLFCGDTLFAAGCGRLFEGTPAQMVESLAKLRALPASLQVCCAHEYTLANLRWARAVEPDNQALQDWQARAIDLRATGQPTLPTTLALEGATNPFLRTDVPAVIAAAARWRGQPLDSPVAVFAALREWKNRF